MLQRFPGPRGGSRNAALRKPAGGRGARARLLLATAVPMVAGAPILGPANAQDAALLEMSIEELGRLQITSVSRREESLQDAPAAVHVITGEEILRSGARSLAEALRLAPGVEVARSGSHSWTVSIRGFSSDLSNKLLVLIDGRSVYSPLYAGVFWDAQDVLLEDIDRIEVIAGPSGTMWGANAVNGVINIITRSAWDVEGGLLQLGGGNEQEAFAGLRYARRIGRDLAARAYAKRFDREAAAASVGGAASDDWDMSQAGFRLDWDLGKDTVTVQGDVYGADESELLRGDFTLGTLPEQDVPGTVEADGHNVLARWERDVDGGGDLSLQLYYDHTERDIPGTFAESRNTADIDFQHRLRRYGRHDLMWGAGVRVTSDELRNTQFAAFTPPSRRDRTYSLFLQDEIDLHARRLLLTLGSKFQRNDYTGSEGQPSARLAWLVTERQTLWAAVSKAVRIPARLNEDLELYAPVLVPGLPGPLYANVRGRDDFESEELVARELGYRVRVRSDLSFDVAVFEHAYEKLQTNEVSGPPVAVPGPPPYLILPIVQGNGMRGDVRGATLAAIWDLRPGWRLRFHYSHLDFDLELDEGSVDRDALAIAGNSPTRQAAVYSFVDLPRNVGLYTGVRYVDDLPNQNIPSYLAVDLSVDWRLHERLGVSLTVQNLNDRRHAELGGGREIERSAFLKLGWSF